MKDELKPISILTQDKLDRLKQVADILIEKIERIKLEIKQLQEDFNNG